MNFLSSGEDSVVLPDRRWSGGVSYTGRAEVRHKNSPEAPACWCMPRDVRVVFCVREHMCLLRGHDIHVSNEGGVGGLASLLRVLEG